MSYSVNLVPVARLHARIRTQRRTGWIGAGVAAAALLAIGWGSQHAATSAVKRLTRDVNTLDVQRSETQRALLAANGRRTQLLDELQTIAAARRPQPWAQRLVTLTREAPPGVFLTAVDISAPDVDKGQAPPAQPAAVTGRPKDDAASSGSRPGQGGASPKARAVRLRGYAIDHPTLLQFLSTLQGLPGWRHVELVRASQEPYRGGLAIGFELDCRTEEDRP